MVLKNCWGKVDLVTRKIKELNNIWVSKDKKIFRVSKLKNLYP